MPIREVISGPRTGTGERAPRSGGGSRPPGSWFPTPRDLAPRPRFWAHSRVRSPVLGSLQGHVPGPLPGSGASSRVGSAVLASMQIFFQGHCRFYFYFRFISQAQAEIFRPIFLASRYHFSKFCQGCESEGRVDSVRARPRLRARLGGSEDSWWAFGEAVCVGASS